MITKSLAKTFHVAGIGASAGGLESLTKLLSSLSENGRVAYVVAQHMAKDGHDELVLRLLNHKSRLKVIQARAGEQLEPDRVYLIPSGFNGMVQNGLIQLLHPAPEHISTPSVNALFVSLAKDMGNKAIGIVLSGVGLDGVAGCKAIKANGGLTLVQNPQSAPYSGMPLTVIQANAADEVLEPEAMAQHLTAMFSIGSTALPRATPSGLRAASNRHLPALLQNVFKATGIDFSSYKEETLLRRIDRRMTTLKITNFEQYLAYIEKYPDELKTLQHLFLVSLSSFFRDNRAFAVVKKHLAETVGQKAPEETIRIWVPGCATGEECYTFAILLNEILGDSFKRFKIRIIGSDLNPEALAIAHTGIYRQTAFKEIEPKILARYFETRGQHYQVTEPIRAACEFIRQDVVSVNAPENLDIVSCRNLLIYMKSNLQDQLFKKFHRALLPQGLLFIGQSENIGILGNTLFLPVDHYHRLYRRK
ncbi:chemotaxis protein CheB [Methylobacter sp.]|uniref:chemotaxis protein CheB n=1 Tax=Methylobacter sp. TaxID=2051955 RepID=UPI001229E4CA|nr:chemotaxis protein CheB [Methylobacter sp.]TAK60020.1 MAG: chemotaxis protein [Methylobacter sp.]